MAAMQLTRTHRVLIGLVVAGAVLIAAIGFAGSYAAVRELALSKGFGDFSLVFPIGIDAGICVLLALDLLLTWLRIPFPLLRQTAWLLTAATIAFNGAAAWPDPLGVGMHAVIPVLFVVAVEAARHAVGRIADITADKHMEGVRLTRWLLSPIPTFRLWRRMKLWELRSYEQVIKLEQDRLIYQARLQARYGRTWRRRAPVESLMPLRLAKYGVPLAETGPAGLAAAGIEPALLPALSVQSATDEAVADDSGLVPVMAAAAVAVRGSGEVNSPGAVPRQVKTSEPAGMEGKSVDAGEERADVVLPDVDNRDAVRGYFAQHGRLPNAEQFSSFLARYGFVDPATGAPFPEALLQPGLEDALDHMGGYQQREEDRTGAQSGAERRTGGRPLPDAAASPASAAFAPDGEPDPEDYNSAPIEEEAPFDEDGPYDDYASHDDQSLLSRIGTAADRTGGTTRLAAQIRIPSPAEAPEPAGSGQLESELGEQPDELTLDGEREERLVPSLTGPALVEYHYRELPPEQQQQSANALAPVLAEKTGYTAGTVRKYVGQIKRTDAASATSAAQG
ncbi:DUF2637 domain-containing protein (plasmid) [Streptomyces sp. NBC_01420]|uniref:DUF2637 domain-containing protein n=1 Tax=Streptomyces sp. NBC_01420 TaxID=2903858 RepID=UPI002F9084BE